MSSSAVIPLPQSGPPIQVAEQSLFMPVMDIGLAVQRYNALVNFTQQIMKEGKDFGKVPGVDKPSLLKPGAEKLCSFFGFAPEFVIIEKTEQWDGEEPFFFYFYKCRLVRNGRVIGEGDGSCNSRESKYRYRWVPDSDILGPTAHLKKRGGQRTLFEFEFSLKKRETGGKYGKPEAYWVAFDEAIAAGTAKQEKRPTSRGESPGWAITVNETQYRVPNPDIADQVNTIQKMAQKRAFIAATLIACNASEYYTQDVEDLETIDTTAFVVDTGGHPVGTQAAADAVAERKIAEGKAKQTAAAKPHAQQPEGPKQVDAESFFRWLGSTLALINKRLGALARAYDEIGALSEFEAALQKAGVDGGINEIGAIFKESGIGRVRVIALSVAQRLEELRFQVAQQEPAPDDAPESVLEHAEQVHGIGQQPADPNHITDDDLPPILRGANGGAK